MGACSSKDDAAAAAPTETVSRSLEAANQGDVVPTHISEVDMEPTAENMKRAGSVYFDAFETVEDIMEYAPATVMDPHPRRSVVIEDPNTLLRNDRPSAERRNTVRVRTSLEFEDREVTGKTVSLSGYPGELTKGELDATIEFRNQLKVKDQAYREMVDCFAGVEEEAYALCRWMRSNKFVVEDVFDEQLEAAAQPWKDAKTQDFFPTIEKAVKCPPGVFLTQYPSLYYGSARSGCPVQYLKAGQIMVEGIECVTGLGNISSYTWYAIMHQFKNIVGESQNAHPESVIRCEAVSIIDLTGLGRAQLNQRTLDVMKQMKIVTDCFPEMLNRMIVVNAPYFFALTWPVIKKLLDPRTAQKIEIFSSVQKASRRLGELVDSKQLLKDMGGTGPSFDDVALKEQEGVDRQLVQLISQSDTFRVQLHAGETATITVYTRSLQGAECTVDQRGQKQTKVNIVNPSPVSVAESTQTQQPYSAKIAENVAGPANLTLNVKAKSTATTNYFLVYVEISKKK